MDATQEISVTLYDAPERGRVRLMEIRSGWRARQNLREMGLQVGDAVTVLRRAPFGGHARGTQ